LEFLECVNILICLLFATIFIVIIHVQPTANGAEATCCLLRCATREPDIFRHRMDRFGISLFPSCYKPRFS